MTGPDLNAMRVFAAVVETGGFGTAAARLDMPIATVSRKVRELEERLQTRLLERTTRRVALTEAGALFHEHVAAALREIEDGESALGRYQQVPRGVLRVSSPASLAGLVVAPALSRFMAGHPQVRVSLQLRNDRPDPVRDGFDLVIRVGLPEQENLVARPLGTTQMPLFAAPSLPRLPGMPAELATLPVGAFSATEQRGRFRWELARAAGRRARAVTESVEVAPALVTNDPNVLLRVASSGALIVPLPEALGRLHVEAGALVPVLPDWRLAPVTFYAVHAGRRGQSPKVRVFLDFVMGEFARYFG